MSLPDEKQVERALRYLEESEEAYAQAFAKREAREWGVKMARDIAFLDADGTVAERQARAGASAEVRSAVAEYEDSIVALETLRAKRQRAILTLEVWRSLNSNRRAGIV